MTRRGSNKRRRRKMKRGKAKAEIGKQKQKWAGGRRGNGQGWRLRGALFLQKENEGDEEALTSED
jgi:hypothetical protein